MDMINNLLFIIFMGLVGALIGWITNLLAIRLLFRPYKIYTVPILGWKLQGLIPKRQKDIAEALGDVVSSELITGRDVALTLSKNEVKDKLARKIEEHVRERFMSKLPAIIPAAIQAMAADLLGKTLYHEINSFLDNPSGVLQGTDLEDIRREVRLIVEDKIKSFDLEKLEDITYFIAKKELKHIELLGGVLGFIIGILQGVLTLFFL